MKREKRVGELVIANKELAYQNEEKEMRTAEQIVSNKELHKVMLDRKQVEAALVESEAKYKTMVTQSPDGFFIADLSGTFLSVNKSMCDILKYTEEEFLTMKILDIIAVQNQPNHKLRLAAMLNGESTNAEAEAEYEVKGKDGIIHSVEVRSSLICKGKEPIGFQGTAHEITEQKRAEKVLHESEEKFRLLLTNIRDVVYSVDVDTKEFTYLSPSFERITGYTLEDIKEMGGRSSLLAKVVTKAKFTEWDNYLNELYEGQPKTDFKHETWWLCKDGTYKCLQDHWIPIFVNGKLVSTDGVLIDITDRKQAEEALRKSERDLLEAQRLSHIGSWSYNTVTNQLEWSEEMFHIWGLNLKLGAPKHSDYSKLIHPEDYQRFDAVTKDAVEHGTPYHIDLRICCPNGEIKTITAICEPEFNIERKVWNLKGTNQDITERKRTEIALLESETKYRTMVTQSPNGIFIVDLSGTFLSVNKSMCDILKYTEEEFLTMKVLDIVAVQNQPNHKRRLEAMLNGESTNSDAEYEVKGKDGIIHFVEVRSSLIYKGKEPIGFQGIAHEITERKRAEKVLRESEEKYRNIFDNIQDVYFETTIEGIILEVSPSIRIISKNRNTREDLIGKSIYDFYVNALERQTFVSALKKHGSVSEFEIMLKNPDGLQIPCSVSSKLHIDNQGHPDKIIGSINDITERKRSEKITAALYNISKAVNTSNTLHSLFVIIHETLDSIIIAKNFYIALIDDANKNIIFQYEVDENSASDDSSVISLDDSQSLTVEIIHSKRPLLLNEEELNKRYEGGKNRIWSTRAKCWMGVPLLQGEEVIGAMAVQSYNKSDIYTETDFALFSAIAQQVAIAIQHKRSEEELVKSELRFRELYQNAKIGLYRTTRDGAILMANNELIKMLGYSSFEELAERNLEDDGFEPSYQRKEFIEKIEKYGEIDDLESTWTRLDGTTISVRESTRVIRDSQGKTLYYDGVVEDITEHKQAMKSIRQYREQLEFALNGTNDGIWDVKMDTGLVYISPRGCAILGYHPEGFHKNIDQWNHMVHPEDLAITNTALTSYLEGKTPIFIVEQRLKTFTGDYKWILTRGKAVSFDSSGKALRMVGTHTDISEQKKAENATIASETRYRRLFESAKDGILILDAETGNIVDVNPFLIELLGYSKEVFVEKEIWEIGFFRDIVANKDKFLELQQKEYVRYDNLPLETAEGRKINVEFVSNVYLVNNKKVIQCNIRDVTERKRIENALISSKTHLRMLVQTIPDLIWTKDADGIYLSCNTMFEKFFGASEADIIGKTDYDFVDRELADFFRENDRKAMEAGKPTSNEEWITFADNGHRAYLETIKAPMLDAQNRLIGVLGIGRDITIRKNAEQKVKESEKRFKAIFNQAPVGIALLDAQGQLTIANSPLSEMVGYNCDELSKKKFSDFTYFEDIDKDQEQFNDLTNGKISMYSMEKRYVHKNGNLVWANLFVTILRDENGDFREILGMAEDISERKRIEKEITMLAQSLKSVNEFVCITDIDNKIFFVNESFLISYGYSLHELIGKNISLVQSGKNVPEQVNEILPSTISGEWKGELLNIRKDGSEFPIYLSTSIVKDKEGKSLGLIGVATDITERKRNEQTLIKLSSAVEQTVDLIVITDRNGTIEYVNRAFEELTGYSSKEVLGKTPRILKSGAKNQEYYEKLWKTILSGKVLRAEMLNKKKNGDLYYEEKSISPIFDKNSNITHFVSTGLDITDRIQAEKELIVAKERAEESDKLKTAFLQNMSHEIRTPMNAIVGFSELIELEIDEPEKLKYYTKVIRQRSDDLLDIINELLDISRIESGQLSFKSDRVDLNKLFEELSTLFTNHKLQIEKPSINLVVKRIPISFNSIVSTDGGKLKQILSNLIHNAYKFTNEGKIEFGFHSISNNKITLFVSDSGTGISENMRDLIFERFRKSADESVYVQDGIGLGLAIVKGLLKLFNGEIRVESEPNEGSTFFFTIPYIPISVKSETEMPDNNQKYDWSKFTLLIVEDDKFNISYFEEILNDTGINLLIGETGNQAISLFSENQNIDLVLMDIKLPDMNGYEITKEFKKMHIEIPIIAQTAYATIVDRQKALDAGCDDFIMKPIKRDTLLQIISRYLIINSKN